MEEYFGTIREITIFKWGGFFYLDSTIGKIYQCVLRNDTIKTLVSNSYVCVKATEQSATIKREMVVNDAELHVESVNVITAPEHLPPFNIFSKTIEADHSYILDNRAYSLRFMNNRIVFKIQSFIKFKFQEFLEQRGFTGISTPKIVSNGAEGGTEVFKLDYFGKEACLAQSPQLYKQMCCGAFGKVYEVGPVFRAEKHNSSRHINEYISLDIETVLAYDFKELIALEKQLLATVLNQTQMQFGKELAYLGVPTVSYIDMINKAPSLSVSEVKSILGTNGEDLSSQDEKDICSYVKKMYDTDFVFITHYNKDVKPFYTKVSPDGIHTESFDCLWKGLEITSGGQRKESYSEYENEMMYRKMNLDNFKGYLDCFKTGMPLHGGFALGLERLTALFCNIDNVKDATLFPRDIQRLNP
jgi:nondiscriminating aspartyl-tRNA synthetase